MTSQNCHLQSFGPILAINNVLVIYRLFQKRLLTISSTSISFTLLGLNKLLKLVEIQTCCKIHLQRMRSRLLQSYINYGIN